MRFAIKSRCQIRAELAGLYATAARLYAEAVANCTQVLDERKCQELCMKAREAKQRAEAAALCFEEHLASHKCHGEPR
jgi:hypothetical protein